MNTVRQSLLIFISLALASCAGVYSGMRFAENEALRERTGH